MLSQSHAIQEIPILSYGRCDKNNVFCFNIFSVYTQQ